MERDNGMRDRLTYAKLLARCAEIHRKIQTGRLDKDRGSYLNISINEFNELRADPEFSNIINLASMAWPPKEFKCHGIRCVIG